MFHRVRLPHMLQDIENFPGPHPPNASVAINLCHPKKAHISKTSLLVLVLWEQ